MTAHVFIVDDITFPVHLRHGFAGTGAQKNSIIDFNNAATTKYHHTPENMLAGMMADINRIRKGDRVLFYLQQKEKHEGRFYGVFRAAADASFIDNGNQKQYLVRDLRKSLTFRALFTPEAVYPQGVTEWEALDVIRHIQRPHQMLWSLIYRKLKGMRGCTMITSYEEERLCALIENKQKPLDCQGYGLDFDAHSRTIFLSDEPPQNYRGEQTPLSLMPRIAEKHKQGKQFESHLQAHIVGNLGRKNDELTRLLIGNGNSDWLGNEIGCGVGMQSIDVMVSYTAGRHGYIMPIELKSKRAEVDNIRQIRRYVDWIEQYYVPNRPSIIAPVLITHANPGYLPSDFTAAAKQFNTDKKGGLCEALRLIEFNIKNGNLHYQERKI